MGTIMKGDLQIGGSVIPVKLTTTARSLRESKAQTHYASPCCFSSVGRKNYCKKCGKDLKTSRIKHRSFEIEKGDSVILEKGEIDAIKKASSKRFITEMFVKLYELPHVFTKNAYYVVPDDGGEIPLSILMKAMDLTNTALVGKYVTRNTEKLAGITTFGEGLVLQNLYFQQEMVEPPEEWTLTSDVSDECVRKMSSVIEAMTGEFRYENFKSDFYEKFKELVLRVKDRSPEELEEEKVIEEAQESTAEDFLNSLEKTLEGVKATAER